MDLFTYLMAKNGNNTSVHGDLFSYLLGKGQSQTQTISGVTIYIPDAKKLVSFMMTKESTQDGEPTPDNPVPVNVVEGYRNLYDFVNGNYSGDNNATITRENGTYIVNAPNLYANARFNQSNLQLKPNITYTFYAKIINTTAINGSRVYVSVGLSTIGQIWGNKVFANGISKVTFTTPNTMSNTAWIGLYPSEGDTTATFTDVMLVEGDQELPYVPYGNNYVNVVVSDGTNTNNYPIPLNNNEIVGIGDYKDELKVDKSGHVFINKKTGKKIITGSESWNYSAQTNSVFYSTNTITDFARSNNIPFSNYYKGKSNVANARTASSYGGNNSILFTTSTTNYVYIVDNRYTSSDDLKNWLSTHNTEVYYVLETPELIDLQTTVDLKLFKGVNNVSNSEDGYMTIEYR